MNNFNNMIEKLKTIYFVCKCLYKRQKDREKISKKNLVVNSKIIGIDF